VISAPAALQVRLRNAVTGHRTIRAPQNADVRCVRRGIGVVRPRIRMDGMKRLVSIGVTVLVAMIAIAGAARLASASEASTPAMASSTRVAATAKPRHHRRHRAHPARHAATLSPLGAQAGSGRQPARRQDGAPQRHRATVPSLGHTDRTQRHPRSDARGLAAIREATTAEAQDAAMLRACAPRAAAAAVRLVGSGRAPPRAGPTDDSEPPHAPLHPPASASPFVRRSAAPLLADAPTPPLLRRAASLGPAVPPVRPPATCSVVPTRPVLDRLPARRPEGTAAGSSMPS
jgi:hypothetical protein